MLVASGLCGMDEHWATMCALTARWPAISAANKRTWDSMGDHVITCLLWDLPVIQTMVGQLCTPVLPNAVNLPLHCAEQDMHGSSIMIHAEGLSTPLWCSMMHMACIAPVPQCCCWGVGPHDDLISCLGMRRWMMLRLNLWGCMSTAQQPLCHGHCCSKC